MLENGRLRRMLRSGDETVLDELRLLGLGSACGEHDEVSIEDRASIVTERMVLSKVPGNFQEIVNEFAFAHDVSVDVKKAREGVWRASDVHLVVRGDRDGVQNFWRAIESTLVDGGFVLRGPVGLRA